VSPQPSRNATSQTIYRDIGGREAGEAVVDDFYERVLADGRLAPYFDGMDMDFDVVGRYLQDALEENGGPEDQVEPITSEVVALEGPVVNG